jgi:hypothetical protein
MPLRQMLAGRRSVEWQRLRQLLRLAPEDSTAGEVGKTRPSAARYGAYERVCFDAAMQPVYRSPEH